MNLAILIPLPAIMPRLRDADTDYFTLFEFSAKYDPVPTMLNPKSCECGQGIYGTNNHVPGRKHKTIHW